MTNQSQAQPEDFLGSSGNNQRIAAKVNGALNRIPTGLTVAGDILSEKINEKLQYLRELFVLELPPIVYSGVGVLGETTIDRQEALVIPPGLKPDAQRSVAFDYITTEAVVSYWYTNDSSVTSLPPEAFFEDLSGLSDRIDRSGIHVTVVGDKKRGIRTRFYRIPVCKFDEKGKAIPLTQQKMFLIQDIPRRDGTVIRRYAVLIPQTIDSDLGRLIGLCANPVVGLPEKTYGMPKYKNIPDRISSEDYKALMKHYDEYVEELIWHGQRSTLSELASLPIQAVFYGQFPGGDTPEARRAYATMSYILEKRIYKWLNRTIDTHTR